MSRSFSNWPLWQHNKAFDSVPRLRWQATILFLATSLGIAGPAFYFTNPNTPPALQILLLILGSYASAIGAVAALLFARSPADSAAFKHRLANWRVPFPLYVEALITPSIAWLAAAIANSLLSNRQFFQWANLPAFPIVFITLFFFQFAKDGRPGNCGAYGRFMQDVKNLPGFVNVPDNWFPLYFEYRSLLSQTPAVTAEIATVCNAGGGDVSAQTDLAVVDFVDRTQQRLYQMIAEAQSMP